MWITSIDLEGKLPDHAEVAGAAVIGASDDRWGERALACIVPGSDGPPSFDSLPDLEGTVQGRCSC